MTKFSRLIHTFTGFIKSKRLDEDEGNTKFLHFSSSYSPRIPSTKTCLATYLMMLRISSDYGICTLTLPKLYKISYILTPLSVISLQKYATNLALLFYTRFSALFPITSSLSTFFAYLQQNLPALSTDQNKIIKVLLPTSLLQYILNCEPNIPGYCQTTLFIYYIQYQLFYCCSLSNTIANVFVWWWVDAKQGIRITASWKMFFILRIEDLIDIWSIQSMCICIYICGFWNYLCDIVLYQLIIKYLNIVIVNIIEMNNEICCIIKITRRQYGHISSRLIAFGLTLYQKKQYELSILKSTQQPTKKSLQKKYLNPTASSSTNTNKYNDRKYQNLIVRLKDPNYTTYMFGNCNANNNLLNEKFLNQAYYLRTDSNFKEIINNWSYFNQSKEIFKKKIVMDVYHWGKIIELEFLQLPTPYKRQDDQIMMIFRDCTSLNLQNYTDKSGKVDTPEILKHKFTTHFKDIFGILSNNYIDMNNLQLLAQNLQAQYNLPTYVDFQTRAFIYAQKLCNINNQKKNQYWIGKVKEIVEFVMIDKEKRQQYQRQGQANQQIAVQGQAQIEQPAQITQARQMRQN